MAQGIKMKVFEIKPKAMASKANGWGIVPINAVKGYLRKIYPELRTGKITTTSSDRDAYAAGRIVGENTSLNNQFGLKAICA